MARPRKAAEGELVDGPPGEPTAMELIAETVEKLHGDPGVDIRGDVAGALATLAMKIDETQRRQVVKVTATSGETAGFADIVEACRLLDDRVSHLAGRVDELAAANVVVDLTTEDDGATVTVRGTSLVDRVVELEQRVHEAGRLLVFHGNRRPGGLTPAPSYLDDVGRALLFDGEQPEAAPNGGGAAA